MLFYGKYMLFSEDFVTKKSKFSQLIQILIPFKPNFLSDGILASDNGGILECWVCKIGKMGY
jgi:hypothetical protein